MKQWYSFNSGQAGQVNAAATLSIFDEIGAWGTSAKGFLSSLSAVSGEELDVEINSPGGDIIAAIAMYNGLRASGKKINVKVLGVAASAASLIAMAGDTIEMPANTYMMIHNPWSFVAGNAAELREAADTLDKIGEAAVNTYASRTGKPADEIRKMLATDNWMTADDCLAAGFCTKVSDVFAAQAKFELDDMPEHVRAIFASVKPPAAVPKIEAKVEPVATVKDFAAEVLALAKVDGLEAHAKQWALKHETIDDVVSAINSAKSVIAYCEVAGKSELAAGYIKAAKSMPEVRKAVLSLLASEDEHIDAVPKAQGQATVSDIDSGSIYAKRKTEQMKARA
jgi:ATP-dependent protease ClpP protease subunit